MGQMRFLTSFMTEELKDLPIHMLTPGDTKITWDPDSDEDTELAENNFDFALKKGHKIYKVDENGKPKGKPVKRFNPNEELYIVVPVVAGG